jgi:hypothetical protein
MVKRRNSPYVSFNKHALRRLQTEIHIEIETRKPKRKEIGDSWRETTQMNSVET